MKNFHPGNGKFADHVTFGGNDERAMKEKAVICYGLPLSLVAYC